MIISEQNDESLDSAFTKILETTARLFSEQSEATKIQTSVEFEQAVLDKMQFASKRTPFHGTIQLISGHRFPDIVANRFFGVEVKSTLQQHWTTTGNSVLESTRIADVDRIFIFFGQIAKSAVKVKFRKYQDCLADVAVTHSPRYIVDMDLEEGKSIFDKMGIPYDTIRKNNPIQTIRKYYQRIDPTNGAWWLSEDKDTELLTPLGIRMWNKLPIGEKTRLSIQSMVLFPEIFGNSLTKFNSLSVWLLQKRSLLVPNIRDMFTSGGKKDILLGNRIEHVPAIIHRLYHNKTLFMTLLTDIAPKNRTNVFFRHWSRSFRRYASTSGVEESVINDLLSYLSER